MLGVTLIGNDFVLHCLSGTSLYQGGRVLSRITPKTRRPTVSPWNIAEGYLVESLDKAPLTEGINSPAARLKSDRVSLLSG
jgi:hypothetical protein